ncbi:MAG: hypothetical protein ABIO50_04255 [Nitrosospira sp.]
MEKYNNTSAVNSAVNSAMYTVRELAEMRLPNLPDTERAWLDRAKKGKWVYKEVPGRGRGGKKKLYLPPPEIIKLIEAHNHSVTLIHLLTKDAAGSAAKLAKGGKVEPDFSLHVQITMAILSTEWLPKNLKEDIDAVTKLASSLYGFLTLFLGSSDTKWQWMMGHRDVLEAAIRFVYANDQMYADLEKDTASSDDISKPLDKL